MKFFVVSLIATVAWGAAFGKDEHSSTPDAGPQCSLIAATQSLAKKKLCLLPQAHLVGPDWDTLVGVEIPHSIEVNRGVDGRNFSSTIRFRYNAGRVKDHSGVVTVTYHFQTSNNAEIATVTIGFKRQCHTIEENRKAPIPDNDVTIPNSLDALHHVRATYTYPYKIETCD